MKKTQITKATCCGRTIRYALLTSIGEDGTRRYGAAVFCAGKEEAVIDITVSKAKALALIVKLCRAMSRLSHCAISWMTGCSYKK